MLLQPFVENSIKHAFIGRGNGEITIGIKLYQDILYFSIEDNGIGMAKANDKKNIGNKSVALNLTQDRLNAIYAKNNFEIKSSDKGTKVSFQLPLKTDF